MDLHSTHPHSFSSSYQPTPHDHTYSQYSTIPLPGHHLPPSPITNGTLSGNVLTKGKRPVLPEVGQTRCYWALLTASLQFTVLDPVLKYHLREQAPCILDRGLLDFVHPDERESAERDLGSVLAERALHGSVTRVRYCRLSRVRRLLGWSDNSLPYPPTFPAERIAVDADYMAVYLVVNCVSDGIVLCFIHAVVDIAPQADNDEQRRTGWSNWCSTYGFDQEHAHALYQRLCDIAITFPRTLADPSLRVLQILQNQSDRDLIISWPSDSALAQDGYIVSVGNTLAQLAQQVQLGYSVGNEDGDNARTSCTRRYKSVQTVKLPTVSGSKILQVESILIPHGTIIFACHKVSDAYLNLYPSITDYQDTRIPDSAFQDVESSKGPDFGNSTLPPSHQELVSHTYVRHWVDQQLQAQVHRDSQSWDVSRNMPSASPSTHDHIEYSIVGSRTQPYQYEWQNGSRPAEKSTHIVTASKAGAQPSSAVITSSCESAGTVPSSTASSTVPTPHISDKKSRSPSRDTETPSSSKVKLARDRVISHGRGQGTPPTGINGCAHCQIKHSPEWRKGPSGKKDLCNACGLRFSRSRAKTEGVASRKRKNKDKELHLMSKQSRALAEVAAATVVREDLQSKDHQREQEAPIARFQLTTDRIDWPGTSLNASPVSALEFSQTSHTVQMPYFS
ncbi:hypothetical protein ACEPAF_8576 [Sanghuangporus sanghuang]